MKKISVMGFCLVMIFLTGLLLSGCGGSGGLSSGSADKGYVGMQVSYPQDMKGNRVTFGYSPSSAFSSSSSLYISYYLIDVYKAETTVSKKLFPLSSKKNKNRTAEPVVPTTKIEYPETTASIFNIPVGTMTFIAYGYDENGSAVLYGSATVEVVAGANDPITLEMSYINGDEKPEISSLEYPNGQTEGYVGDTVTVQGKNFGGTTGTLYINDVEISDPDWSDTAIKFSVPYQSDSGAVTVVTGDDDSDTWGDEDGEDGFKKARKWRTVDDNAIDGGSPVYGSSTYYAPFHLAPAPNPDIFAIFTVNYTAPSSCYLSRFDARSILWNTREKILSGSNDSSGSNDVAFDDQGKALAVFCLKDVASGKYFLGSNYYDKDNGWQGVEISPVQYNNEILSIKAAFVDSKVMCIYNVDTSGGGSLYTLFTEEYTPGTGWGDRVGKTLDSMVNSPIREKQEFLKKDSQGNLHLVYYNGGEGYMRYYKYRSEKSKGKAKGWDSSYTNIGAGGIDYYSPHLDVDDEGNVMTVFVLDNGISDVYYSYYDSANGSWTVTQKEVDNPLDPAPSTSACRVFFDRTSKGNKAVCVYSRSEDSVSHVREKLKVAYSSNGGDWTGHKVIDSALSEDTIELDIAQDSIGKTLCIFTQGTSIGGYKLYYSQFDGTGWSTNTTPLLKPSGGVVNILLYPRLICDDYRNLTGLTVYHDGTDYYIRGIQYY